MVEGVRSARGSLLVHGDGSTLEDAAVAWRGDTIVAVGPWRALRRAYPDAPCEGGREAVIVPGLVNAHQHGHGLTSLSGGVADQPLETWLAAGLGLPVPGDRAGILLAAARLLRSGVTTAVHLHACRRPADPERMLRRLDAWRESGLSIAFASGFKSRHRFALVDDAAFMGGLPPDLAASVASAFGQAPALDYLPGPDWAAAIRGLLASLDRSDDRVRLLAGPPGPEWCLPADLELVADVARTEGLGIHVHVAESPLQAAHAREAREAGEAAGLAALARAGLVGPRTSLVHGVQWQDAELDAVANLGAQVVTCPGSNLRLRHGVAPVGALLARGVSVALGTDSLGLGDRDDIWAEARLMLALHGGALPGAREEALDVPGTWAALTSAGARVAEMPRAGRLEPGARADLVLLDGTSIQDPATGWGSDPAAIVLGRARPEDVRLVVGSGRDLLRDGTVLAFDEQSALEEARESIARAARDGCGRDFAERLAREVARQQAARFDPPSP